MALLPNEPPHTFTCNICGTENSQPADLADREQQSCTGCHSTSRHRAVVMALSRSLFGLDLPLVHFPSLKTVSGIGISDSEVYADELAKHLRYTNTFYHKNPRLDLTAPNPGEFGRYDFVICSEVLEHVQAPVEEAFFNLRRLLKPDGFLILTLPYSIESETVEHFDGIRDMALVEIGGRTVVIGEYRNGGYQVFDHLVFHGGPGSTLEMRLFSYSDIQEKLIAAGFSSVQLLVDNPKVGVTFSNPCSVPMVVSNGEFSLRQESIAELAAQISRLNRLTEVASASQWMRLGRALGLGPNLKGKP